jgi:hypothetical protein
MFRCEIPITKEEFMKKMRTAVVLLGLSLPVAAQAVEFQPIGALGIGGAGVARNNGALTSYWNPAGGAFNETPFAMHLGFGIGAKGSDGLAENVDRISDIEFDSVKNFDNTTADVKTVGDMVKAITIINDIGKRQGNIALNGNAPLGFSIKHVSFGIFGNFEGYILPKADTINMIPNSVTGGTTTSTVSVTDLYNAIAEPGVTYAPCGYFSPDQLTSLTTEFNKTLGNTANAQQLAFAIDNQFIGSDIPAATTFDSLTTFIPLIASGGTNTFDKNTTSAMTKALMYYEVPLSYGHPFDFGRYGKLGVGATAKIISGAVYQNQILIVNRPEGDSAESDDLVKDITKNSKSSVNFGVDLGALYKYDNWLSVGLVAKNLNSPKFSAPDYDVPEYDPVTKTVKSSQTKAAGEDVKLKPQVRAGIALDPFSWLTIASDLDLTENDTVAPGTVVGSSVKSRNFGGGVEIHPYSWLRIRGGAYKNLADSDVGLVLTTGFTLFLLDVDGAFATDTFKLGDSKLPQEAKIQLALSFAF